MLKLGNQEVSATLPSVQKALSSMSDQYYNEIKDIIDELADLNCNSLAELLDEYLEFKKSFDNEINGFINTLTNEKIISNDFDVYTEFDKIFNTKKEIFYLLKEKKKALYFKHEGEIGLSRYEKIKLDRELNMKEETTESISKDLAVLEEIKGTIFINNFDKKKEFISLKFDLLIELIIKSPRFDYLNINSEELNIYTSLIVEGLQKVDILSVYFIKNNNFYTDLVNEVKTNTISNLSIKKYALFIKEYKECNYESIKKNIKNAR